jgi:hypothetical protein
VLAEAPGLSVGAPPSATSAAGVADSSAAAAGSAAFSVDVAAFAGRFFGAVVASPAGSPEISASAALKRSC